MSHLPGQRLAEEDARVSGRDVEAGKFPVAELRIEIRRLKRKRVEPGRVAAEIERPALRLGHQATANPAPAQIPMHPKIFDEQPAGVDVADQTGADRAVVWSRASSRTK